MTMHPIPEESLVAFLAGRLEDSRIAEHLRSCADCGRVAAGIVSFRVLFPATPEPASQVTLSSLRTALPRRTRRWRPALAAAAVLLLATGLLLRGRASRSKLLSQPPPSGRARLFSAAPGVELFSGPGALLQRQEQGWQLARGACLVFAQGSPIRLSAGALAIEISDGELLLKRTAPAPAFSLLSTAFAEACEPAEAVLLSGSAEALLEGKRLPVTAGEQLCLDAQGVLVRKLLSFPERLRLREAILPSAAPGEGFLLDGRSDQAARLVREAEEPYQAFLRFRLIEKGTLGLSFKIGGGSSLWVPEGGSLDDGSWHTLRATVSASWVTLEVDGVAAHRVPRDGFRLNPVAGISGIGPAVWGGRMEVSGFAVHTLK